MTKLDGYRLHGRNLVPHTTEVSIRGERGRFVFLSAEQASTGAVSLTFLDARNRHFRSFRPERVRTVHRTRRTR
jgi:hypothetical protein